MLMSSNKIEDMNSQAQLSAAQQLATTGRDVVAGLENATLGHPGNEEKTPELETPEDDGPVDETGVDPKDIDLVMAQVNCSRAKAVRVLKESGGDLINASTFTPHSTCTVLTVPQSWQLASDRFDICCAIRTVTFVIPHVSLSSELENAPTSNFYVVIRPLPSVLHDGHTLSS